MKIAIAGNGLLGFSLMKPLLASSHEVVALVQDGRAMKGWKRAAYSISTGMFAFENTLSGLAMRNKIPKIWIDKMDDAELEPLRRLEPDILLVGGFGIILKRPILDLPKVACINTHTSLLPRHRGPNPFSAVIMQSEKETGLTFHLVDEGIDTGPILAQFAFPVTDKDTAYSIYTAGCEVAGDHVVDVIDDVEKHGVQATMQDAHQASYDKKLHKNDYRIDWDKPADYYERLLRAGRPFFTPWFRWRGKIVYLIKGRLKKEKPDAAPGTVLAVEPKLKVAVADGVFIIDSAITMTPVPWVWPMRWHALKTGDKLECDDR